MSELSTLARPYAVAVFKQAVENNTAAKWSADLAFLSAVVSDAQMLEIVDSPVIAEQNLLQLMQEICTEHIAAQAMNLINLLIQNNRLGLIPEIAQLFEEYKAEHEGYVDVQVTSAYAFTKQEEKNFSETLGNKLKKTVQMSVQIDKSLIGGVLVRAGDIVIDGSIKGQLQLLAKQL